MDAHLTSTEFEKAEGTQDWRVLTRGVDAWFEAPSTTAAAALVTAIADGDPAPVAIDVRVRRTGVRVTLQRSADALPVAVAAAARRISALAAAAGLRADPSALCDVQVTVDATDADQVMPFWAAALGYDRVGSEDLVDPLRRNPPIWFQGLDEPRPLRNRIHVDSIRRGLGDQQIRDVAVALSGSDGFGGAFGVALADREGNEVDLVPPGDDWADRPELADWVLLFAAMAHYPTSRSQAAELVAAAAALADRAGVDLMIDVTAEGVTFDSGKDGWEMDDRFAGVATEVQAAARALGLVADPEPLRFLQLGIDAADIDAVRDFWRAVLGYVDDPRRDLGVTDIYDPLRFGPPVFFQDLDADPARQAQRNRIHLDLYVPADQAQVRVATALAAGGRIVRDAESPFWVTVADPEGNEVDIAVITGREQLWGTGG